MSQPNLLLPLLLTVLLMCAAAGPQQTAPPAEPPPPTRTAYEELTVIDDCFVTLPIVVSPFGRPSAYSSGSRPVSFRGSIRLTSAGTAIEFLKSAWPARADIDLQVFNCTNGARQRVFGRPVAIQANRSFRDGRLVCPGTLLIEARVEDADGDGRISGADPVSLHQYDLASGEVLRVSPDGTDLIEMRHAGDELVLVLQRTGHADLREVYRYDPRSCTGSYVNEIAQPTAADD